MITEQDKKVMRKFGMKVEKTYQVNFDAKITIQLESGNDESALKKANWLTQRAFDIYGISIEPSTTIELKEIND